MKEVNLFVKSQELYIENMKKNQSIKPQKTKSRYSKQETSEQTIKSPVTSQEGQEHEIKSHTLEERAKILK